LTLDVFTHSILPFVGILFGLIVVHEAGHYITAKMFGVTVLEAGIGFPPRVWGFRWRDTDYTINLLPIGAFVRLLGEEDPSDTRSLAAQPKWKRTVIIGAGAFMNLVLAIALFTAALMIPRNVSAGGAQIMDVAPGSPAEQAGLKPGDQILTVNGRKADNTSDASYLIHLYQGTRIDIALKRPDPVKGAQLVTTSVYARWNPQPYRDECGVQHATGPTGITIGTPFGQYVPRSAADAAKLEAQSKKDLVEYRKLVAPGSPASCYGGSKFGFIGMSAGQCSGLSPAARTEAEQLKQELFRDSSAACYRFSPGQEFVPFVRSRHEPIWEAVPHAARMSFESLILARNQIWSMIRRFGSSPVTGPVGIAQATGEVVSNAGWLSLIDFAALLSMNLAVLNILPIPMFDGGRLVFILIEFLRRGRRIAPQKEALVHLTGLALILTFSAVITYFDLLRIFHGDALIR
jgi:regulator of sigma E protease